MSMCESLVFESAFACAIMRIFLLALCQRAPAYTCLCVRVCEIFVCESFCVCDVCVRELFPFMLLCVFFALCIYAILCVRILCESSFRACAYACFSCLRFLSECLCMFL